MSNPVLAAGEIGVNTSDNTFKIGDGQTAWSQLAYQGSSGGGGGTSFSVLDIVDTNNPSNEPIHLTHSYDANAHVLTLQSGDYTPTGIKLATYDNVHHAVLTAGVDAGNNATLQLNSAYQVATYPLNLPTAGNGNAVTLTNNPYLVGGVDVIQLGSPYGPATGLQLSGGDNTHSVVLTVGPGLACASSSLLYVDGEPVNSKQFTDLTVNTYDNARHVWLSASAAQDNAGSILNLTNYLGTSGVSVSALYGNNVVLEGDTSVDSANNSVLVLRNDFYGVSGPASLKMFAADNTAHYISVGPNIANTGFTILVDGSPIS
jgi:hypothetical protein